MENKYKKLIEEAKKMKSKEDKAVIQNKLEQALAELDVELFDLKDQQDQAVLTLKSLVKKIEPALNVLKNRSKAVEVESVEEFKNKVNHLEEIANQKIEKLRKKRDQKRINSIKKTL